MKLFLIVIFSFNTALAAMSDSKVHIEINKTQLEAKTDPGFHINQEAPAKLTIIANNSVLKPTSLTSNFLSFDMSGIKARKFTVSFYVCDDKNTSCELHKKSYEVKNNQLTDVIQSEEILKELNNKQITFNSNHFIKDNLPEALALATKENKLLFVDFAAPWCPACVRLDTEIFKEKTFKKITKDLITLTLNSDLNTNHEAFKKYDVKILPTLIIMKANGDEIYRMIDYKPLAEFNEELKLALDKNHSTPQALTELASKNDKFAIKTLATRAFVMNNYAEALKWYDILNEESLPYAVSKISLAENEYQKNKKNESEYLSLLKKAILSYPSTYESLDWRLNLAEIEKDKKQKNLNENIVLLLKCLKSNRNRLRMFKNTTAGTIPFPLLETYSYLFKTYEEMQNTKFQNQTLKNFRNEIKKIKTTTKKPGELMMIVQYQKEAKMPEEENSLKALCQTYPENHVYHMKLGNFYLRNLKYKEALAELITSTKLERPVSLYNLSLLAKAQKNLNLKKEMQNTIEAAENLPEAMLEKNAETIKSMRDLLIK